MPIEIQCPLFNVPDTKRRYRIDRSAEGKNSGEVWTAKFGAGSRVGSQVNLIVPIRVRIFNAEPANGAWPGLLQQLPRDVNKSAAISRQHPLVAGRAERVNFHALHIDLEGARRLRRVNDERVA